MSSPLVSIVLPVYNGFRYLDESVRSCLDQTYSNFELIIVDDASTDNTPQLIERWTKLDHRVRAVRHETNRKLPAALNTGFSAATGTYLTWTSDDNAYRPDSIEEMVAVLEKTPEVAVVYADYTQIDEDGRLVSKVTVKTPQLAPLNNWVGCCFLYRRSVHDTLGGYDEKLFLAEDYDFWLRAAASFRFAPLHKDLYLYRRHSGTLTSTKQKAIEYAVEQAICRSFSTMRWLTRKDRAVYFMNCAMSARYRDEFGSGRLALCKALYYSPATVFSAGNIRLITVLLLGAKLSGTLRQWFRSA